MEYGLIGGHLGHSFSKTIHEMLTDCSYDLMEVAPEDLPGFMTSYPFKAINVTIPYKEKVMPFLDVISEDAAAIGAVNTVVRHEGKLFGYNTDFMGFTAMARSAGIGFEGRSVLVLGAGGAAKTVAAAAVSMGASSVTHAVRTPRDASQISLSGIVEPVEYEIIINATPVGMFPDLSGRAVDLRHFPRLKGVLDCVYNPLRTNLVLDAQEAGVPAAGGLYMLVAQACFAEDLFHPGETLGYDMDDIFRKVLSEKTNIVLMGMPSCGKTTLGRLLSSMTGRQWLDTDDLIRERIGMDIPEFFAGNGEQAFRDVESEVIADISSRQGMVVSLGGGAVLNPSNVRNLKMNGCLVYVDRALENLQPTEDRPLSRDREALARLASRRIPVYRSAADVIIDNNGQVRSTAERIIQHIGSTDGR